MKSIQAPLKSMPCWDCRGKGYVLKIQHLETEAVMCVADTYLNRTSVSYRVLGQVQCDKCGGKGKWELPEVKY